MTVNVAGASSVMSVAVVGVQLTVQRVSSASDRVKVTKKISRLVVFGDGDFARERTCRRSAGFERRMASAMAGATHCAAHGPSTRLLDAKRSRGGSEHQRRRGERKHQEQQHRRHDVTARARGCSASGGVMGPEVEA